MHAKGNRPLLWMTEQFVQIMYLVTSIMHLLFEIGLKRNNRKELLL